MQTAMEQRKAVINVGRNNRRHYNETSWNRNTDEIRQLGEPEEKPAPSGNWGISVATWGWCAVVVSSHMVSVPESHRKQACLRLMRMLAYRPQPLIRIITFRSVH